MQNPPLLLLKKDPPQFFGMIPNTILAKSKLDQLYKENTNTIRIRSECDWYEYGKKFTKFFIILKKFEHTRIR